MYKCLFSILMRLHNPDNPKQPYHLSAQHPPAHKGLERLPLDGGQGVLAKLFSHPFRDVPALIINRVITAVRILGMKS